MRAVLCTTVGKVADLEITDLPSPPLAPGTVRVAVAAAGLNYVDALFVAGEYQIKPNPPFIPGSEVAGVISEVAPDVSDRAVGDRVLVSCGLGGFASELVIAAQATTIVPDALSLPAAATLTQSYCTALFALRDRARLAAGEVVLVLGAGGGVGYAAIDVAGALGATSIAAASTSEKQAHALDAGAAQAFSVTPDTLKDLVRSETEGGVDVVVDPVGADLAEPALRTLREFGRYLVIGFAGGHIPTLPTNQILLRNRSVLGVDWGAWAMSHGGEQARLLDEILTMVAKGDVRPPEPSSYKVDDVKEALDDLTGRRVIGKAVLTF
jgi:NADPH2:quinone reductase